VAELALTVIDPAGLHARPAARFVQSANAKSLIALLGLTIRPSSRIVLAADGPDADEALAALAAELSPYVEPADAAG
jgi:phosphotransferase system HPr-like phosphotransfer protein